MNKQPRSGVMNADLLASRLLARLVAGTLRENASELKSRRVACPTSALLPFHNITTTLFDAQIPQYTPFPLLFYRNSQTTVRQSAAHM
jgi:hypothetical protein